MASHYEETMQRDIGRIRDKVSQMAELAAGALEASVRGLLTRDLQIAYKIILRDRRIDELEKEIDRLCLEFLVRQQPAARHLRFAYSTIKVNQELERIGDYAESIARQVIKLSSLAIDVPGDQFQKIASMSIPMLRDAVRAFTSEDGELARKTAILEDEIDALRSQINADLLRLREKEQIPLEALTPLMTIARRFERVADQARNICEEVVYMTTGEYAKHVGADVWRVLFVDRHNSCRSQMAEAIGNSLGQPQFVFASAGLDPHPIDPGTVEFLRTKGIDLSRGMPRAIDQVPTLESTQIVVALAPEAKKAFPAPSKAVSLDWSLPDPSKVNGSPQEKLAAYEAAYQFLHEHISDLCEAVLADRIE